MLWEMVLVSGYLRFIFVVGAVLLVGFVNRPAMMGPEAFPAASEVFSEPPKAFPRAFPEAFPAPKAL